MFFFIFVSIKHPPNLFTDQVGLAHVFIAIPLANKELSEERIQRLLLATQFFAAAAVLLAKGTEEPSQNSERSLLRVGFLCWGDEQGGVLSPVGRVFGQRGTRKDEGGCGQGREVAVERSD